MLTEKRDTTKKDVGAEYRHDMRPSTQLPSDSGVDGKLGLTKVRPSLLWALEFDSPPITEHDARFLWSLLTSGDLEL